MDVERILDCLPQTQCARCGHAGCRPYAEAIAAGEAINRCPPGGETTIRALADLLGLPPLPPDPAFGEALPAATARIREEDCIGCFKCVRACPVDAILGAPGVMHTVITAECTGCGLCLPPCPVDCIDVPPLPPDTLPAWSAERARRRADARVSRLQRDAAEESLAREAKRRDAGARARRAVLVREAVERVRARRQTAIDEPGREG